MKKSQGIDINIMGKIVLIGRDKMAMLKQMTEKHVFNKTISLYLFAFSKSFGNSLITTK